MSGFPEEPACWSWPLPAALTREEEIERLSLESLDGGPDRWLPPSACRMLTRDWPNYLLSRWHDERCAICGARPGHLVVDHEHRTGLVRGRLCRGCNVSEGVRCLDEASAYQLYRERPPAVILDVQVYYVGRGWADGWWHDAALARQLTGNPAWEPAQVGL